jgi:hypothetical protein
VLAGEGGAGGDEVGGCVLELAPLAKARGDVLRGDWAGLQLWLGRQTAVARAARSTVAAPEAVSVHRAPRLPTIGPSIAVPRGSATTSAALRATRTPGKFSVVVIDCKSA